MTLPRQWSYPAGVKSTTTNDAVTQIVELPATPGYVLGADIITVPTLITAPPNSASIAATTGTAVQNTLGYDSLFVGYLNVTAASVATVAVGVSSASVVATTAVVSGYTASGPDVMTFPAYVPAGYWYQISTSQANGASITATLTVQSTPV